MGFSCTDPTPLMVFHFERSSSSGVDGWALLKELENMIKRIIDSRKYLVWAVKLDVNIEADHAAALKMKTVPTLKSISENDMLFAVLQSDVSARV